MGQKNISAAQEKPDQDQKTVHDDVGGDICAKVTLRLEPLDGSSRLPSVTVMVSSILRLFAALTAIRSSTPLSPIPELDTQRRSPKVLRHRVGYFTASWTWPLAPSARCATQ